MSYACTVDEDFVSAWIPLAAKVNDVLRFLEGQRSSQDAAAIGLEAVAAALENASGLSCSSAPDRLDSDVSAPVKGNRADALQAELDSKNDLMPAPASLQSQ